LCAALAVFLGLAAAAAADERFEVPAPDSVVVSGAAVEVRWSPSSDARQAREQELVLSLDGGLTFPIRVSPEMSAHSTGFRWIVPGLSSGHARLAVRCGSGEGDEDETLEGISGEFTIVSAAADSVELVRGATEWWTRQALLGVSAEDLLVEAMRGPAEQLVVPDFGLDISEPNPPAAPAQGLSRKRLAVTANAARPRASCIPAARPTAPLPLRL
jgi:hypothetical protein